MTTALYSIMTLLVGRTMHPHSRSYDAAVTGRLLLRAVLSSGHPPDVADRYRRSFLVRKRPLYGVITTQQQHSMEEEEEEEGQQQWGYLFEAPLPGGKDDPDQVRILSMMLCSTIEL